MDNFANQQRQHKKILSLSVIAIFLALIIGLSQAGYLTAGTSGSGGGAGAGKALNPQPLPPGIIFMPATSGQHFPKASPPGNQSGGNQTTAAANQTTAAANQTTAAANQTTAGANKTDPIYITTHHAPKASPPGNQSGGNMTVSGNTTGNATGNVTSGMMKTYTTTK